MAFLLKERFVKNKGQKTAIIERQRQNIAERYRLRKGGQPFNSKWNSDLDRLRDEKDKNSATNWNAIFICERLTHLFLFYLLDSKDIVIEPQDANVEIVEQIFRFKKRFL